MQQLRLGEEDMGRRRCEADEEGDLVENGKRKGSKCENEDND